jgi:GT2 family glycosyltransferase
MLVEASGMKAEEVTIVVLNWNGRDDTLACLESLAQADLGGASVLVVDNGSRDGSVEAIRQRFPTVRVLPLPENRGFAGGNNAGIRAALDAGAAGVLLLNNDTRVSPDFLPPLLGALAADPRAGAVCSAIHRMDRPEMLDVGYAEIRFGRREAVRLCGVNALPGQGFDTRREIQVGVGCSLLLTAEALRAVGPFDESYFAYHEDVDWSLRARRAGFQILYEPFSRVFHRGSGTTGALGEDLPTEERDPALPDLPNAEPLPWNPIRTYLGSRNLVRLLRTHATPAEKCAFACSCVHEIPLELLAIVLRREGWMRLGRWSYPDAARLHFVERHPFLLRETHGAGGRLGKALALAALVPFDLLWTLPREIWRAQRQGRTQQFAQYLRGLRDGILDRPLPLERLGLR